MGTRSRGGYKLPENNTGREWHGAPIRVLTLTGKRHRRYRVRDQGRERARRNQGRG